MKTTKHSHWDYVNRGNTRAGVIIKLIWFLALVAIYVLALLIFPASANAGDIPRVEMDGRSAKVVVLEQRD
jgi:hypothetical protein